MQTGDERYLPVKDRGPVRRYVRDHVDARWNLGEFFLPVAMVFVLLTLLFVAERGRLDRRRHGALPHRAHHHRRRVRHVARACARSCAAKFGDDAQQRGLAMYAVLRVFQLRRARLPKPQVKRGQYPV